MDVTLKVKVEMIRSAAIGDLTLPLYLATAPTDKPRLYYYGISGTEWGALEDMAFRFSLNLSGVTIERVGYK